VIDSQLHLVARAWSFLCDPWKISRLGEKLKEKSCGMDKSPNFVKKGASMGSIWSGGKAGDWNRPGPGVPSALKQAVRTPTIESDNLTKLLGCDIASQPSWQ